jgi:hypothetical protein
LLWQLDAAAWVDIQPIIPNMMTLQDMTVNLYGFTTPPIPAACAAQYTGQDAWCAPCCLQACCTRMLTPLSRRRKCMWPSYRLPFIQTQYFLNAAQFDGASLALACAPVLRVLARRAAR